MIVSKIGLGAIPLIFCASFQINTVYETEMEKTARVDTSNNECLVNIIDINSFVDIDKFYIPESDKVYEYFKDKYANNIPENEAKEIFESIVSSSISYDVDYRLTIALIHSESRFKTNIRHKNSKVMGLGGIHSKYWTPRLKKAGVIDSATDLNDTVKNIEATVFVMRYFLDHNNNNILEALHSYKGRGYDHKLQKRGSSLAKSVYNEYLKIASEI